MINRKEFEICKRRGHQVLGLGSGTWLQCKACGTWVRKVTTIEERKDRPPEDEISPPFKAQLRLRLVEVRGDEEPIDQEELEICKRRGHVFKWFDGWEQCSECKIWICETQKIEEREERPAEDGEQP